MEQKKEREGEEGVGERERECNTKRTRERRAGSEWDRERVKGKETDKIQKETIM